MPWGKAMMWIFLLSDTFIFTCFLTSYMNVRMSTQLALAESERRCSRCTCWRPGHPADPDRDHDLRADHLERHDGARGQLRLPARPPQDRDAAGRDRRARRDLRRHAGLRVDQADHGRRAALGESLGRAAVRLRVLHDHGIPRLHVSAGVIYLLVIARRVRTGFYDRSAAVTRRSRSRACTGTSSISSGYSSSRSSISGEAPCRRLKKANNTRSRSTCGSGCSCSCSARSLTWWTTSTCRACCAGR